VSNGEEKEDILFKMRAKIYRWRDDEWKERGTGMMKLLRHKENYRIRFIMRQEKTLKVIANFTSKVYKLIEIRIVSDTPMMCELTQHATCDRAYLWICTDYSEVNTGKQERFTLKL
jgi:Ran-binding protein 1